MCKLSAHFTECFLRNCAGWISKDVMDGKIASIMLTKFYYSIGCELGAWASYQIRKNCVLCMRRECRERFPRHRLQMKPQVSDPGIHQGTCITHVPWCMPGSLTHGGKKNATGVPGACATRNFVYMVRGPLSYTSADMRTCAHIASLWSRTQYFASYNYFSPHHEPERNWTPF